MIVFVNTPVAERHRAMLEQAAAGRCELLYADDGADATARAQVIIGTLQPGEVSEAGRLQWLQLAWAGADHIVSLLPQQVTLTNSSGAYGVMIAEHMMATLLALVRQLRHYDALQKQHLWRQPWRERTLEGKTVLILGTGDIGQALAKRLQGFDCRIIGLRRRPRQTAYFHEVHGLEALDDLLPQADVVACALPGTAMTKGLLHKARLLSMKPDALLVNCGRGTLIPGGDLTEVLQAGHLGGCALDVTDPEPLPADSALWDMENVLITPHISGATFGHLDEVEDKVYAIAAENLDRYLSGRPLLHVVDKSQGY